MNYYVKAWQVFVSFVLSIIFVGILFGISWSITDNRARTLEERMQTYCTGKNYDKQLDDIYYGLYQIKSYITDPVLIKKGELIILKKLKDDSFEFEKVEIIDGIVYYTYYHPEYKYDIYVNMSTEEIIFKDKQ